MNCKHCEGSGWQCEYHNGRPQGHKVFDTEKHPSEWLTCTGAGIPCDKCDAFPHKKKLREFWISCDELIYGVWTQERKGAIHVREVVDTDDKEIEALRSQLKIAVEALEYYGRNPVVFNKVTCETREIQEIIPHVVWDTNLPGEVAAPKPFGTKANEALERLKGKI